MFKVLAFMKRKVGTTPEQFKNYYEKNHVPLILSLTHTPLVYKRNYLNHGDKFNLPGPEIQFDCVTEQIFASKEDFDAWIGKLATPENGKTVREDEARFLDHSQYYAYTVDEQVSANNYPKV